MRHNFSKRKNVLPLPNLSSVQLESYDWLIKEGVNEVLDELGTIEDYTGRGWVLTLSDPQVEEQNISIDDALRSGRTFDAPWYLKAEIKEKENIHGRYPFNDTNRYIYYKWNWKSCY